eukprot:1059529-Amphidinium_carterae.1
MAALRDGGGVMDLRGTTGHEELPIGHPRPVCENLFSALVCLEAAGAVHAAVGDRKASSGTALPYSAMLEAVQPEARSPPVKLL